MFYNKIKMFVAFFLPCIDLLTEASKNSNTRDFLVNSMHFVPLIGDILLKTDDSTSKVSFNI